MGELISGKDALIALANGEEVQSRLKLDDTWNSCIKFWTVNEILSYTGVFRIKPCTTTINGIEVPATFNPKEGEVFYYINDYSGDGYDWVNYCDNLFNNTVWIGKWRSEDEVKQVMAALRSVFNTK